jgi:TPR repeat protein
MRFCLAQAAEVAGRAESVVLGHLDDRFQTLKSLLICGHSGGMKRMTRCFKFIATIATALLMACGAAAAQTSYAHQVLFEEMLKLATEGQAEAEYHVGMFYNNGIGTPADPDAAFAWFKKAADAGDPLGSFKLGCYYAGQFPSVVEIDRDTALKYKLVAAEQGYDLAQLDVGRHHYDQKDYPEAIRWWKAAAKQGEPSSLYHLSALYAQGKVVPADLVSSFRYLSALRSLPEYSADQQLADAYASLTKMMNATELSAANEAAALVIEPTPLTLKAHEGLSQAKLYLAANMR